jgi:hypothetical protein
MEQLLAKGTGGGGGAPVVANPFGYAKGGMVQPSFSTGGMNTDPRDGFFNPQDGSVATEQVEPTPTEAPTEHRLRTTCRWRRLCRSRRRPPRP